MSGLRGVSEIGTRPPDGDLRFDVLPDRDVFVVWFGDKKLGEISGHAVATGRAYIDWVRMLAGEYSEEGTWKA